MNFELHTWAIAQRLNALAAARPECKGMGDTLLEIHEDFAVVLQGLGREHRQPGRPDGGAVCAQRLPAEQAAAERLEALTAAHPKPKVTQSVGEPMSTFPILAIGEFFVAVDNANLVPEESFGAIAELERGRSGAHLTDFRALHSTLRRGANQRAGTD